MSPQRCETDHETRFGFFQNVKLSTVYPLLDHASVYMTEKRRLAQRHHSGLCFTPLAPRNHRTCNATGDHNLGCFNGDPGASLDHVQSPYQALPTALGVVDSDGGS